MRTVARSGTTRFSIISRNSATRVSVRSRNAASSVHGIATPGRAVEQRAFRDRQARHLLEAQGLGAELHLVGIVRLSLAAFVFDRKRLCSRPWRMDFDRVGVAGQAKPARDERQPAQDPQLPRVVVSPDCTRACSN